MAINKISVDTYSAKQINESGLDCLFVKYEDVKHLIGRNDHYEKNMMSMKIAQVNSVDRANEAVKKLRDKLRIIIEELGNDGMNWRVGYEFPVYKEE